MKDRLPYPRPHRPLPFLRAGLIDRPRPLAPLALSRKKPGIFVGDGTLLSAGRLIVMPLMSYYPQPGMPGLSLFCLPAALLWLRGNGQTCGYILLMPHHLWL